MGFVLDSWQLSVRMFFILVRFELCIFCRIPLRIFGASSFLAFAAWLQLPGTGGIRLVRRKLDGGTHTVDVSATAFSHERACTWFCLLSDQKDIALRPYPNCNPQDPTSEDT